MNANEKAQRDALDLLRQATESKLTRRDAIKAGLVAGGAGLLAPMMAKAQTTVVNALGPVVSPPHRPWLEAMPVPSVLSASSAYAPTAGHQYYNLCPPQKFYKLDVVPSNHSFHPDLGAASGLWTFNGKFPGPTINAKYGEPFMLRINNKLPALATYTGFGIPQTINHLHNAHTATESDGGPWNWKNPGQHEENHYMMMRAGFSDPASIPAEFRDAWGGDKRETLSTLFMHAHRPEFTAPNVYKGMVNMVRFFDEMDTGSETTGWRLPSGAHDVPLVIADKAFDPGTGQLVFDQFATDGFLGDKMTVNGKIQPFFNVKRRKYRFRILNGGPARSYILSLRHEGFNVPMTQIGVSGNLLERPAVVLNVECMVADRPDVIVDFSTFPAGARIYLSNSLPMQDGRRARWDKRIHPDFVENQLVEFRVQGSTVSDPSRIPAEFRPLPPINLNDVVKTRVFNFERTNGAWAINGKLWDPEVDHSAAALANPPIQVKRNTAEKWVFVNNDDGWDHPVHNHMEEGHVLSVNGVAPTRRERRDIYHIKGKTRIEMFQRFRDFPDPTFVSSRPMAEHTRYVMHCHNMNHEDHAMMITWNVVP
jgi:FtsP/CotA-like multicopper oxidase with cupredoxin domain